MGHWAPRVIGLYGSLGSMGHWTLRVIGLYGSLDSTGHWAPQVIGLYGSLGSTGHAGEDDPNPLHEPLASVSLQVGSVNEDRLEISGRDTTQRTKYQDRSMTHHQYIDIGILSVKWKTTPYGYAYQVTWLYDMWRVVGLASSKNVVEILFSSLSPRSSPHTGEPCHVVK